MWNNFILDLVKFKQLLQSIATYCQEFKGTYYRCENLELPQFLSLWKINHFSCLSPLSMKHLTRYLCLIAFKCIGYNNKLLFKCPVKCVYFQEVILNLMTVKFLARFMS